MLFLLFIIKTAYFEKRDKMEHQIIFNKLQLLADPDQAISMSAYMRNLFPFLGISAKERKATYHSEFKQALKEKDVDFDFIQLCFNQVEREYHYAAVDYLLAIKSLLGPDHLPMLKQLIITKSWWDTVDGLDGVIGFLVKSFPELKKQMVEWSLDSNIWIRRVAIDHQLLFKEETDAELLALIIKNNLNQTEFFINKAIGWSLRDYSKTNPEWVSSFIEENKSELAPLSIREGSKYL